MSLRAKDVDSKDELPESLQSLVFRNGLEVRPDPDFHHDMDRLVFALNYFLESS